ncbi:MAG: hypothetical protein WEK74_12490, partial [Hydrogenophaga sp.]
SPKSIRPCTMPQWTISVHVGRKIATKVLWLAQYLGFGYADGPTGNGISAYRLHNTDTIFEKGSVVIEMLVRLGLALLLSLSLALLLAWGWDNSDQIQSVNAQPFGTVTASAAEPPPN